MWKYTIYIILGILLFLLLNRYDAFSIGGSITYYYIPYTEGMTEINQGNVITITFNPTLDGDTTTGTTTQQYRHANTFGTFEGETQQYWITTRNPTTNSQDIINDINTRPDQEPAPEPESDPERLERERLERERLEREIQEREGRESGERSEYIARMMDRTDNEFRGGDIIIYATTPPGMGYMEYIERQVTTTEYNPRGNIGGASGGAAGPQLPVIPEGLPGYGGNTPRMYFVVRPQTINGYFRTTTTYTIVGFGGMNILGNLDSAYIESLANLNRFVPIEYANLLINTFNSARDKRMYEMILTFLRTEFNRIHNTELDITDYVRLYIYLETACAAISEGVPPERD